ncbi:unnamed protein product [Periconia digitata]|uniref:P-type Cu(+) transporter n=1 Tax=Periconia digitata TaxID=1303443 RepID=A0A9W4U608_9PLEO|nr:unnamed protein product [Periconia digitata]
MACGSSCCGSSRGQAPVSTPQDQGQSAVTQNAESRAESPESPQRCNTTAPSPDGNCCGDDEDPSISVNSINDDCCSSPTSKANHEDKEAASCCNDSQEDGCSPEDKCCSDKSTNVPSCCEGKSFPCCGPSCIDRLALRECVAEKNTDHACPSENPQGEGNACQKHKESAWGKYRAQLETLGCICRTLLARNQETCCTPSRNYLPLENCCSSSDSGSTTGCRDQKEQSAACADSGCSKGPLSEVPPLNDAGSLKKSVLPNLSTCASACCKTPITQIQSSMDLEKGVSSEDHIVLSIQGMTCTGCETKLSRTLASIPTTLSNIKTSLVLARAEFDNHGTMSPAEIIAYLEKTTEFKCELLHAQGSTLDLVSTGVISDIVNGTWPAGVTDVKSVGKNAVRVHFDASIIGARDLLGHWSTVRLAPHHADPTIDVGAKHVRWVGLMTLLSILLTIPVLVLGWAPIPGKEQKKVTLSSISLALTTIIQFVVAGSFYPNAIKALIFSRVIEMDLLIVLSSSAAYVFSVVSFGYLVTQKPLSTGEFFETSALLITLIMLGRYLAALARQKAIESVSIRSLQCPTATILTKGTEQEVDTRLLQYGDIFIVPGDTIIPTDGQVISGCSEVNESMITGEFRPVEKYKSSTVIAGSMNGPGVLNVRLTKIPGDNTVSTIAKMVDDARLSKPKIQGMADKIASYFVPIVLLLAVIVFCIWVATGITIQNKSESEATIQAITYAICVLIVSCPCAIGLAVPMVVVVACGVVAKKGVIFKSSEAMEVANKTTHVVFDKTGTLTKGQLGIVKEEYLDNTPRTKALLLGLVQNSKHPVALAVAAHLVKQNIQTIEVSNPQNLVGKGIEASSGDEKLFQNFLSQEHTTFCFTINGSLAALFNLQDALREDTLPTLEKLRQKGISVHILSGDEDGPVRAVASELDISVSNWRSRCSPADKQAYVKALLAPSASRTPSIKTAQPVVMFCGDGTNDAAALAQATIGVHMNEGTDVAGSAADIVLMRPGLAGVLVAINMSSKAMNRIAFNFGWSFVYNLFAVLLASGAFVRVRIPPEFAGLGELVSVLPVVAAGVLLKWTKI